MAYKNERRVIELIPRIDVDALGDLLLARLQISSSAGFTEYAKACRRVQRVLFLQPAIVDLRPLVVERLLDLMLPKHGCHGGKNRGGMAETVTPEFGFFGFDRCDLRNTVQNTKSN